MSIITKLFGTRSDREVKKIMPLVEKIESLEDEYRKLSDEELKAGGVSPDLIRLSCGLEGINDILADLEQALAAI